jgi:7-cyano-7-deazaguanine synthase
MTSAAPAAGRSWRAAAGSGAAAVALLSGGLDSGVALALWQSEGGHCVLALTADYGQRAAARELDAAQRLAQMRGVPWRRLDLRWLGEVGRAAGCALTGDAPLPPGTAAAPGDARSAAAVWVPARNLVLAAAAAAFAEVAAAPHLLTGFNREEAVTFPDNSPRFVAAFNAALALGCGRTVEVTCPTLALDKTEIVAAARRLGLGPDAFWSCYDGGEHACGRCESCARSARAWAS